MSIVKNFLIVLRNLCNKTDVIKIASERAIQKTADLIGNKIADSP